MNLNPVIRSADIIVAPLTIFCRRKIKPMKMTVSLAFIVNDFKPNRNPNRGEH